MPDPPAPPDRLAPSPGGSEYVLRPDLFAVHGGGAPPGGAAAPVMEMEGVRVFRGAAEAGAGPVYALGEDRLAVPTGRVFVRFREGVDAAARAEAFRGAGFQVERVPGYAPHAAWVTPVSGAVSDALSAIGALRSLDDVEGVEPELLMERGTRR